MRGVAAVIICYCIGQTRQLSMETILSDGTYENEKFGRNVGNNPETMGKGSSKAMDIGTGGGGDKYQAPNYTQYTNQDFKGYMPNYQSMVGMSKSSNGTSGKNVTEGAGGAGSFGNFLDLKSMMDGFMELQKEQAKADALKAQLSKNSTNSSTLDKGLIDDGVKVIAKKREAWPGPHGSVAIHKIPLHFPGNSELLPSMPQSMPHSMPQSMPHHPVNSAKMPMPDSPGTSSGLSSSEEFGDITDFSENSMKTASDQPDFTENLATFPSVHGKVKINNIPMGRPGGQNFASFIDQAVPISAPNFHPEKVDMFPNGLMDIFPNGPLDILGSGPVYALLLVSWRNGQFGIAPLGWISQQDRNTQENVELQLKGGKARRNIIGSPKSQNLLLVRLDFGFGVICPTSTTYLFVFNKIIIPQKTIMCPANLPGNTTLSFLMAELEKEIQLKLKDVVDNSTGSVEQRARDVEISFDQSGSKMELEEVSAGGGGEKGKHQGGGISVKIGMINNKDDEKNIVRNKRQNMMNLFFTW